MAYLRLVADSFRDREYLSQLANIALPITLQQVIISSLNMVSVMLLGQLGEVPVAAVGLANQVFFLLQLALFGINSGCAIFTAQYWGKGDQSNIRRVLGVGLIVSLGVGLFFTILAVGFPVQILSLYSDDPAVIAVGVEFLRIFGWAYLFFSVMFSYAMVLRSIGNVRLPLIVSVGALSLSTALSYILIFGKIGFPTLGVQGAAVGGLIARVFEMVALLALTYTHKSPAAMQINDLRELNPQFALKVLAPMLPVAANEIIWSLGITTYNAIYARLSTESIAAINIALSIDGLVIVSVLGIANACAIMVGNRIGAGKIEEAILYARRSLVMSIQIALLVGVITWLSVDWILAFYQVSAEVLGYARNILGVIALFLWLRAANIVLFIGILRAGGDTRYAFLLDAGIIWVLGVPMAYLGAFVLRLPVYLVYLMVYSEEITKWILAMSRFFSNKWIHNLTESITPASPPLPP